MLKCLVISLYTMSVIETKELLPLHNVVLYLYETWLINIV